MIVPRNEALLLNGPEQRVFGNAYSFSIGAADDETQKRYFQERKAAVDEGEVAWVSRTLDADHGVVADLYRDRGVVATMVFDFDTDTASVYITSEGGEFGNTTLCDQVTFDEAVTNAETFADPDLELSPDDIAVWGQDGADEVYGH